MSCMWIHRMHVRRMSFIIHHPSGAVVWMYVSCARNITHAATNYDRSLVTQSDYLQYVSFDMEYRLIRSVPQARECLYVSFDV
jgi:hypothetical protein